jgi:hypothetical protein
MWGESKRIKTMKSYKNDGTYAEFSARFTLVIIRHISCSTNTQNAVLL